MSERVESGRRIGSVIIEKQKGGQKSRDNIYNSRVVTKQVTVEKPKQIGGCSSCQKSSKLK